MQSNARNISLDVMRGATLALMIIVNMSLSEKAAFSQLLHASWHGFTLTDAVFPTFLFCVGASISMNYDKFLAMDEKGFWTKILRRSTIIFLCGFFISNFPFVRSGETGIELIAFENLRILGVLQRIALCYLIAMVILRYLGTKGAITFSILTLIINWMVFTTFGDLSLEHNVARKIDFAILGASHLYKGEGIPFDPEGLIGTLPSVVNVISGFIVANFLMTSKSLQNALKSLSILAIILIGIGIVWNLYFPINKKIWTSSYVVLMIGIDTLVLALLSFCFDLKRIKFGADFFGVFGKNTLFLYMFAEILMGIFWSLNIGDNSLMFSIYDNLFQFIPGKFANLFYAIAFMFVVWIFGLWLDKKKIYIRI